MYLGVEVLMSGDEILVGLDLNFHGQTPISWHTIPLSLRVFYFEGKSMEKIDLYRWN